MRFIKITKVVFFKSVEVFCKDLFLALYFSCSSSMIFWLLCLLPSAAHFMLTIWPFVSPPPCSPLRWRPHKELCFEYWCLLLNLSNCEVSFSVDLHQANLLLLNSRLHFNPTSTFLGVIFDHTLPSSKHVSLLKAKFFLTSQGLTLYLCFLMGLI